MVTKAVLWPLYTDIRRWLISMATDTTIEMETLDLIFRE